jgi:putative hemolysin
MPAQDPTDRKAALRDIPPLIKAYLRLGGVVGEGACVDTAFNTVDVCMILDPALMTTAQRARAVPERMR